MPDAAPIAPPPDPTAGQPAPTPATPVAVTSVAVLPVPDADGNASSVAVILEQAGNVYVVSYYDASTNLFYTGTDSADTCLIFAATPELDALMAAYGTPGNINTLARTPSGLVDFAAQGRSASDGPSGGIVPVIPRFPYLPDALLPITGPTGTYPIDPFNPPPGPGGGIAGIGQGIRSGVLNPWRPGDPLPPVNPNLPSWSPGFPPGRRPQYVPFPVNPQRPE